MRSKKKSKDTLKEMKRRIQGYNNPKSVKHRESNPKKEIYSITSLSQKQEKAQINNLTLHLKEL